jgi:GT2 family glycosyltransferase
MINPFNELRQRWLASNDERVERLTRVAADVDWVSGACLLVGRADAVAAGLLDERFFLYTEDVDFCAAIRRRGRRVLFVPAATVVHHRGRSRASAPAAAAAGYRRSQIAFYEKHHPRWARLLRRYLAWRGQLPRD